MESKELTNVVVSIKDDANKINHGKPISVKFSINKEEDHLQIEKVVSNRKERERSVSIMNTENGANVSYQQNAKKIHLWWYMTSDTMKAPISVLRNELLAAFDRAIEELKGNEI